MDQWQSSHVSSCSTRKFQTKNAVANRSMHKFEKVPFLMMLQTLHYTYHFYQHILPINIPSPITHRVNYYFFYYFSVSISVYRSINITPNRKDICPQLQDSKTTQLPFKTPRRQEQKTTPGYLQRKHKHCMRNQTRNHAHLRQFSM